MGVLTMAAIAILIISPLNASLFARSYGRGLHKTNSEKVAYEEKPILRYFGRPNVHFKNYEIPITEAVEPEVTEESYDTIERMIRDAFTAPQTKLRSQKTQEVIDIDYNSR